MSQLFLLYAFTFGIFVVLMTFYALTLCLIYCTYRKKGLTRKQCILTIWNLYV
jgi:hypothetical protein